MEINGRLNENIQTNEQQNDIWKNIKSPLEKENIVYKGTKQPNGSQLAQIAQPQSYFLQIFPNI